MEKIKERIEQDGIEFDAFRCKSCGVKIMDMKQLKGLADKYREFKKAKKIDPMPT